MHKMIKIRRKISQEFTDVMHRFLPTLYVNAEIIKSFDDINQQIADLKKVVKINEQYVLMANYCREYDIKEIDVSLDKTPGQSAEEWLQEHFKGYKVFNRFRYPIFHLTKYDMYKIAVENKWMDILSLTSFCRRPDVKITPCGTCGSCVDTVISGMGFRLPLTARIKAKIQIPFRTYWRKNYPENKDK